VARQYAGHGIWPAIQIDRPPDHRLVTAESAPEGVADDYDIGIFDDSRTVRYAKRSTVERMQPQYFEVVVADHRCADSPRGVRGPVGQGAGLHRGKVRKRVGGTNVDVVGIRQPR